MFIPFAPLNFLTVISNMFIDNSNDTFISHYYSLSEGTVPGCRLKLKLKDIVLLKPLPRNGYTVWSNQAGNMNS